MARAGQEIHGQDGFRLRLIRTAAETGGELLEMEATYGGTGSLPPEHDEVCITGSEEDRAGSDEKR